MDELSVLAESVIFMVLSHFRVKLSPIVTDGHFVTRVYKISNKQSKAILNFATKPNMRFIFPNFAKIT